MVGKMRKLGPSEVLINQFPSPRAQRPDILVRPLVVAASRELGGTRERGPQKTRERMGGLTGPPVDLAVALGWPVGGQAADVMDQCVEPCPCTLLRCFAVELTRSRPRTNMGLQGSAICPSLWPLEPHTRTACSPAFSLSSSCRRQPRTRHSGAGRWARAPPFPSSRLQRKNNVFPPIPPIPPSCARVVASFLEQKKPHSLQLYHGCTTPVSGNILCGGKALSHNPFSVLRRFRC